MYKASTIRRIENGNFNVRLTPAYLTKISEISEDTIQRWIYYNNLQRFSTRTESSNTEQTCISHSSGSRRRMVSTNCKQLKTVQLILPSFSNNETYWKIVQMETKWENTRLKAILLTKIQHKHWMAAIHQHFSRKTTSKQDPSKNCSISDNKSKKLAWKI